MDRLRGKRLQSRSGSRWTRNTTESVFGLAAPSCPSCGQLNPHAVGEPPPRRCKDCQAPMNPRCPAHGEAGCEMSCDRRPCAACGSSAAVPPFIDPRAWNRGLVCTACGREKQPKEGEPNGSATAL